MDDNLNPNGRTSEEEQRYRVENRMRWLRTRYSTRVGPHRAPVPPASQDSGRFDWGHESLDHRPHAV